MEIWKKIPGYEGLYWVSSMGRVRNAKGVVKRLQQDEKGYPRLNLCKRGKVKCFRVHRLVAMAFLTGSREHLEVDHINRDRSDNRAENLRWVTHTENMRHPETREACRRTKLSTAYREKMRPLYESEEWKRGAGFRARETWANHGGRIRAAIRKKYPQELRDHVVSMRNSGMKFRQIASALRIDSKLALNLFHREVRV